MVLLRESMQEYSNFFGSCKALFGMLLELLFLALHTAVQIPWRHAIENAIEMSKDRKLWSSNRPSLSCNKVSKLLAFFSFFILHYPHRDISNISRFQFSPTFLFAGAVLMAFSTNRSGLSPRSDSFAAWSQFRSTFPISPCASIGSICPSQLRQPSFTFVSIFHLEGKLRRRTRPFVRRTHLCESRARGISSPVS